MVCEVPKVLLEHRHTLGTYRHTLGCSAELPKVLLEHRHTLGTYRPHFGYFRGTTQSELVQPFIAISALGIALGTNGYIWPLRLMLGH